MRRRIIGSSCAAALLAFAVAATGQTSSQTPTQSPVQGNSQTPPSAQRSTSSPRTSTDQEVTLVGCVMHGSSSTATTGAGPNDFVLSNATMAAEAAHPSATTGSSTSSGSSTSTTTSTSRSGSTTTGISGQATGTSYALMGGDPADLSKYVGQRVEVVGHIDRTTVGTTGTATGSADAGARGETARTGDRHEGEQPATPDTGKDQASAGSTQAGATAGVNAGTTSAGATVRDGSVGTSGRTPMARVTVVSVRPTTGSCL